MANIDLLIYAGFAGAFGRLTAEEKAEFYRTVAEQVALAVASVAAERERCAKIAETHHCDRPAGAPLSYDCPCEFKIAAKIRSGE